MTRLVCLILIHFLISANACRQEQDNEDSFIPIDYLREQRSYPYGFIDKSAYRDAVSSLRNYYNKSNPGFDDPWIFKGPGNISGRVTDIEMHPSDTMTIYIGTASGGVLKSIDQGKIWESIFDDQPSLSIGDLAIAPGNKEIVVVGTGEANAGGSSVTYDGLGLFKSADGGKKWENIGLGEVGSIGKIAIHPGNNNIIYVAAMGHLFNNNKERGVYKTTDGGSSWQHILSISDSTGAIDLVLHPHHPDTLFTAMWERKRGPGSSVYGGSTSGLYRSYDGGQTWTELKGGLPEKGEDKGRIGIAISHSEPDVLYAYYADAKGSLEGIYRSDNGGNTWSSKSLVNINNVSFTWWFGRIHVHPHDADKVFVTGLNMFASDDGGDNWKRIFFNAHIDHHAFYVHPLIPDLYLDGHDGGADISHDAGITYSNINKLKNIQFYTCTIDPSNPEIIYGGTQDNGILGTKGNIEEWKYLWGGDGFSVLTDPVNNSRIMVQVARGHIGVSEDGGSTFEDRVSGLEGVFNWNAPLVQDSNNPDLIYTASQSLYVTGNWGLDWQALSTQLIQPVVGQGNMVTGTFTAIDVSSENSQYICLGSDQGEVWLSRDSGVSFQNISHSLPQRWVTSVKFDNWSTGIYVSLSGFRFGEMTSHLFYSKDEGLTWIPIAESLPDVPVNDIVVDDILKDHLYLATDVGVFYTPDKGNTWEKIGKEMPVVPVCDLDKIEGSRMLCAATYGKGIYSYELPLTTSLSDPSASLFEIYPNPSSGRLHIPSYQLCDAIYLFDSKGHKVGAFKPSPILNLDGFKAGTYILKITGKERVFSRKLVICP